MGRNRLLFNALDGLAGALLTGLRLAAAPMGLLVLASSPLTLAAGALDTTAGAEVAATAQSAAGAESAAPAADEARILRFPATNGREIVFSSGDQLYAVGMDGGVARRLTDGPGYAIFPRFSPDGRQLAFTAQYDGNTEVYLMPAEGGVPRRLTYTATLDHDDLSDRMGPNNIVLGWTNRTGEILFRSRMRSFNAFVGGLWRVGTGGDLPVQVPVPRGGFASFSPDDRRMAYNRVFQEFRTWKDYRGGMADDIWIIDLKSGALEDITNNPAQDIIPMWGPDNAIYFLSDRTRRMNLFRYDLATKATVQLTHFTGFDIKFPSLGGGSIVFEEAGCLWRYGLRTAELRRVPVRILEDDASARAAILDAGATVESVHPSPDGRRAVVVARGRVFTVPARDGPTRLLSTAQGVHERDAVWSPDGRWIAYDSDESGENELYIRPQDGNGTPRQLTRGTDTYDYAPVWSPDSAKLLWSDRLQRLQFVDVETKAVTQVDHAAAFEIRQYGWSPDSRWIAYARPETGSLDRVWLYSLARRNRVPVTDGWYEAGSPVFSDDGKYLLFASGRDFHPLLSDTDLEGAFKDLERVYLVTLAKATESPLKPRSDEVAIGGGGGSGGSGGEAEGSEVGGGAGGEANAGDAGAGAGVKAPAPVVVTVDEDGLSDRVVGLPIEPSNYDSIRAVDGRVYYLRHPSHGPGSWKGDHPGRAVLAMYDLKARAETELGRVTGFEVTADGRRMLVSREDDYTLMDLPKAKVEIKDRMDFGDLRVRVERRAEWQQIYDESWRQMRDFFYSPTMNGVDWRAMHDKYAGLLPYARTRYDVTYLIGELIGELHSGHTYVGGGDLPAAPRIRTGLLGAELSRDPGSRAYRIDRILRGENWRDRTRSPLTELGVDVAEGDYILAVDGRPVRDMDNLYASLVGRADRQVTLRVNTAPVEAGARTVTVVPIADEGPLYYGEWIRRNTAEVDRRSGGRVGYIHLPDMGSNGLAEFARRFYPQLRRKALIIDDRGNGGGFVSPLVIEQLRREMVLATQARNAAPVPDPEDMLLGPKVLIMDELSASDGDLFPYRFRALGLGLLIGKRTWGGVNGIRGSLPFVDGGYLDKPEFGAYAKDGSGWPIEGRGVDPDIVVDNDPATEFAGVDQQLERAIDEVLAELKAHPQEVPPAPPFPDRS